MAKCAMVVNATDKVKAELRLVLSSIEALEHNPNDSFAVNILKNRIDGNGKLIIGNADLMMEMQEELQQNQRDIPHPFCGEDNCKSCNKRCRI